jgi:hypothetical protein
MNGSWNVSKLNSFKSQSVLMFLILVFVPLLITGCTNEQFLAYLLNKKIPPKKPVMNSSRSWGLESDYSRERPRDIHAPTREVYSMPLPAIDTLMKSNVDLIKTARKDLESFSSIASHLRKYKKTEDLKLLEEFAREYIREGIDSLIKREIANDDPLIKTELFKLQILKATLYYEMKNLTQACETLETLETIYGENEDINIATAVHLNNVKNDAQYMFLTEFRYMCKKHLAKKLSASRN